MNIKAIIERVRDRFSGRGQECDCDPFPVVRIPTPEATTVEAVVVTTSHSNVPFLVGDIKFNVAPGDDRVIWLVLNGTQEVVTSSFIAPRDGLAHPDGIARLVHGVLATADPEILSPTAVGDDELGGYLATRHLLDLGHRQIALVAGPSYASTAVARQAGYRRAMAEAGQADFEHLIHESTFGMESGETVARALLTRPDRPTAIFAVNDNTAIGVLAAAQAAGFSVPDDLSVVGYNDIPVSARLPVALTSVRVPFDRIATHAVDLLTQQLTGTPSTEPVTATPTLIPRQSTARPPAT